jgi:hypothetical protein
MPLDMIAAYERNLPRPCGVASSIVRTADVDGANESLRAAEGDPDARCLSVLRRRELHFRPAFLQAKERVSKMDVRFVEEADPLRQALFEMYVSIALPTQHNSFENH